MIQDVEFELVGGVLHNLTHKHRNRVGNTLEIEFRDVKTGELKIAGVDLRRIAELAADEPKRPLHLIFET